MPATSPEQAIQQFSQHLKEGDLEGPWPSTSPMLPSSPNPARPSPASTPSAQR
jgi:hypothetical protein